MKISLLLSFLFAAITVSAQVNPQCPVISVDGPAGIVEYGEPIPFTATVKPTESKLTFKWTVTPGAIVEGQGTPTIKVSVGPDDGHVTATVEIGGLPQECANVASETVSDLTGDLPIATELDVFSSPLASISDKRFRSIINAIYNDPTAQIYVLVPARKEIRDAFIARLSKFFRKATDSRSITTVETNADEKSVQIWLVPPGASPPTCEDCEKRQSGDRDCPALEVTGPTRVVQRGDVVQFSMSIPDIKLRRLGFAWTVSGGSIVDGEATGILTVKVSNNADSVSNITVSVTVTGLPIGCRNTASDSVGIMPVPGEDPVDTYGKLSLNDEYARIQNGVIAATHNPGSLLVFIRRSPAMGAAERNRMKMLNDFIVHRLHFPNSRYRMISKIGPWTENTIWLVPPGAKMPE